MQAYKKTDPRGYAILIAMFAIVALSIIGISAVNIATNQTTLAGNFRRRQNTRSCAEAGAMAFTTNVPDNLPDPASAIQPQYSIASGFVAQGGHYASLPGSPFAVTTLPASAMSNIITVGENLANRLSANGGSTLYRIVSVCNGPSGSQDEYETVIQYGVGH